METYGRSSESSTGGLWLRRSGRRQCKPGAGHTVHAAGRWTDTCHTHSSGRTEWDPPHWYTPCIERNTQMVKPNVSCVALLEILTVEQCKCVCVCALMWFKVQCYSCIFPRKSYSCNLKKINELSLKNTSHAQHVRSCKKDTKSNQ